MASTRLASASASSNRPRASATPPSSLSVEATWGCTLPNTRSRITRARSNRRWASSLPCGGLIVIRSVERLRDVERLAVVALSVLVMSPLLLHGAEVDQILGDERVALTVQPASHPQNEAVERIGDRKVPGVVVRVCQLAQAGRQLRCGRASGRAAESNRLLEHLDRLGVLAPLLQDLAEGERGAGDRRVVRPKLPLAHLQAFAGQSLGFLILGLVDAQPAERHQASGYFGIVGSEERAPLVESRPEQRIRPLELS